MNNVIAIHQPNFFPWLGYFDKIVRSDRFVFLDHVQFPKTGGTWSNRVKMLVSGEARWITAPIVRDYHGVRAISEMEFQPNHPWRKKVLKTIVINYSKAPHFKETIEFLETLLLNKENNLSSYNTQAIRAITEQLGISGKKYYWSSQLIYHGQSNEMLVSLIQAVRGNTYMSGSGAGAYMEDKLFKQRGVALQYQIFQDPVYPQLGTDKFIPRLSVIDALMNIGWKGVQNLLEIGT